MSTATAIDLSQLPAPNIIEPLDYEAILAEILAPVLTAFPTFDSANEADPAVKILQIAALRELIIRQRVNDAAKGCMIAYAVGADLENLGANLRVAILDGETDDAYRARIILSPEGYSVAGPEGAYVFHARSADPGVSDATAVSPTPCNIVVTVLGQSEEYSGDDAGLFDFITGQIDDGVFITLPDTDVLAAVTAALSEKTVRPLGDEVAVQTAQPVDFTLAASVFIYDGPDREVVLAAAKLRLARYMITMRKLGRDVTVSGIMAALHVEGVQRVTLGAFAGVAVNEAQIARCISLAVTIAGIDE